MSFMDDFVAIQSFGLGCGFGLVENSKRCCLDQQWCMGKYRAPSVANNTKTILHACFCQKHMAYIINRIRKLEIHQLCLADFTSGSTSL